MADPSKRVRILILDADVPIEEFSEAGNGTGLVYGAKNQLIGCYLDHNPEKPQRETFVRFLTGYI